MKPKGTLTLVGTPIGNLEDVSPRTLAALKNAEVIACEDTRRTGALLQKLGLAKGSKLISHYKDNERARLPELLKLLQSGQNLVLVSDGGLPAISDPGALLVAAAREVGLNVQVVDGPSAVTHAVAGSGLASGTGAFCFLGFLPRKGAERQAILTRIKNYPEALVIYEAPTRIAETVAELADLLGNRPAWLARELTKLHEQWHGPDLVALAAEFAAHPVKGECVLVIAGRAGEAEATEAVSDATLLAKLKAGEKAKDVAAWLALAEDIKKSEAYARVTRLKEALRAE